MKQKKTNKLGKFMANFASEADVSPIFLSSISRIQITGNSEILIENHQGILEYGTCDMRINCGDHILSICGDNLELKVLNADELSIIGNIKNINFNK